MPIMDYKIPDRYASSSVNVAYHSQRRRFVSNNAKIVQTNQPTNKRKYWCAHQVLKLFFNLFTFNNRVVPIYQHD